jgi:hypothetical protein
MDADTTLPPVHKPASSASTRTLWTGRERPRGRSRRWIVAALALAAAVHVGAARGALVAPPQPPSAYPLPAQAIWVGSGTELTRALSQEKAQDIILKDGRYHTSGPFDNEAGHRLFAEHQGKAILTSGLNIGSNDGAGAARVQGLVFDVREPGNAANGAAIEVWGTARNTIVADVAIDGHGVLESGIAARQPEGLVLQRVTAANFRSWGIFVDADDFTRTVVEPPLLEDLDVANVSRLVPQSSDGTAEACIWVGNTAVGRRFRVRNCAWMGVWTGTAARNTYLSDIDIDDIGITRGSSTGLYLEHFTTDSLFERLRIGPNVTVGVICEWADPAWESRPACDGVVIQDSLIHSRCVGAYLDDGTRNTTLRRTAFVDQERAAIAVFNDNYNILYDTSGNDYGSMKPSARIVLNKNNPCQD